MNVAKALSELKNNLQISWNGEDEKLKACLERGQAKLNGLTGTNLNYDSNIEARALLLDYCRYDYNNCSEYFEENFGREILRLQLKEAVPNG